MIIIEGPDNAGKSTLASYIAHELGLEVYHAGGPPASKKEIFGRAEFILNNHDKFIFDRTPMISEPVYCILRGGDNFFACQEADELYARLKALKPIIIYCRPPDSVLMDMSNHQVKEHDSKEHVERVMANAERLMQRYDLVMGSSLLPPHWTYDYTTQEHDVLIEVIRNEIQRLGHYQGKDLRPALGTKSGTAG